jgi:hypothetical protein
VKLTTTQLRKIIKEEFKQIPDELVLDKRSFAKLMKDAGDGLPLEEIVLYAPVGNAKIPATLTPQAFHDELKHDNQFVGKFSQFSRRTLFVS